MCDDDTSKFDNANLKFHKQIFDSFEDVKELLINMTLDDEFKIFDKKQVITKQIIYLVINTTNRMFRKMNTGKQNINNLLKPFR